MSAHAQAGGGYPPLPGGLSYGQAERGWPLQTIVDTQEAGADTVDLAADPRVAYLLIESEQIRWRITLQEAVPRSPVSGSARD